MIRKALCVSILLSTLTMGAEVTFNDEFIKAGETQTLTKDNTYILDGFVYVEDGSTLNIEPGTVIKGKPGDGENASALIIARGGKINANGTASEPIIFTALDDDVSVPDDLEAGDRGLWGGVIILGKAPLNFVEGGGGQANIEGIPESESRGAYGGNDPMDNSGIFRYVSIRHGGSLIGADNEINGLTMGAVGSGTTIEYVEVYANLDDGFEWFGGTVNTKYLIAAFCGDDAYDYDQGFRGWGQYWFALQAQDKGNHGGEHDGGPSSCETCRPYAIPTIMNATYIGSGKTSANTKSVGMILRDNAGAKYYNSIFTEFSGPMLKVEDLAEGGDSKQMFENGNIEFANNIFWNFGAGSSMSDLVVFDGEGGGDATPLVNSMNDWGNKIVDPQLGTITGAGSIDPHPAPGGPAAFATETTMPPNDWFDKVSHIGAFGQTNWAAGWTQLSQSGMLADWSTGYVEIGDTLSDDVIGPNQTAILRANQETVLKGFVYVEEGALLIIEEGAVIKALPGDGENASALVVAKGGKIEAVGTSTNPIIFTSVDDDVTVVDDLEADDRGLWGGVIILGKAPLNFVDGGGGTANIEGIPESETRGSYGGNDPEDNSGTFKYVSIRHGGSLIGADNEINGLTMGAVGAGTTIEYVEVFSNLDDGFEWFGGTVNTRYLVAAFCGDDAFDYDQGFRGVGQFWFALQSEDKGNHGGEHDGGPSSCETCEPYAIPTIYNATYIGSGAAAGNTKSNTFILRDNAGAHYANSIFTDFSGTFLKVEDLAEGGDSKQMYENGHITFKNNIVCCFGAGSTWEDLVNYDGDGGGDATALRNDMSTWANSIVDPQLGGIGRDMASPALNPMPATNGPAYQNLAAHESDFLMEVDYKGAFDGNRTVWVDGWTMIRNYMTDNVKAAKPTAFAPAQMRPINYRIHGKEIIVNYTTKKAGHAVVTLHDATGRVVRSLVDGNHQSGSHVVSFSTSLPKSFYVLRVSSPDGIIARPLVLVR